MRKPNPMMEITAKDMLDYIPEAIAKAADAAELQAAMALKARLEYVVERKLLCEFHGIRVFEHNGQRHLDLSNDVLNRLRRLDDNNSDSNREMVEDLTAIALMDSLQNERTMPLDGEKELPRGETAASVWAKTAVYRGFWSYILNRLAPKLKPLYTANEQVRKKHASRLKKEFAEAIDIISQNGGTGPHGAATLVKVQMPDGSARTATIPCLALREVCLMIRQNLVPPSKAELRRAIEAKWPEVTISTAAWAKVWKAAGIEWLGRRGQW